MTDLIGECTNISCGYQAAHTADEVQDWLFLETLMPALLAVDWENLPSERQPGEVDEDCYGRDEGYMSRGFGHSSQFVAYDDDILQELAEDIARYGEDYAADIIWTEPETAAQLLVYLASR